jgi:hypothetical protein
MRPAALGELKKVFLNVDTYYDKKELKFEAHDFKRIQLPQKVKIPELSMNLIHVVQNPGIYTLQSVKRMNKSASMDLIENLPTPEQISFENLDTYMRPYEDPNLKKMMKQYNYKYSSSTSGIGEALAHFFYKLTNFKSPHFYNLSEHYVNEPLKFMMFQRKPASISLHKIKDSLGTRYAISKNTIFDNKVEFILLKMGKYMEKIFTNSPEEFEKKYMKKDKNTLNKNLPSAEEILLKEDDYFNFVGYDNILLRSQIDCGGKDKDGNNIVFEIKTRAVAPVRYDVQNYKDYLDYELTSLYGRHSSYEREYYDLIRGAFLKYLFQLKIGGMKGALISYHNTQKIFGFEYISLIDMERRILGNSNFSDVIFKASLKLIQDVLDHITADFPEPDKLLIGFYANEWKGTLDVFVEIVNEDTYKDYDQVRPREIVDYYYLTGYRPNVHKYTVIVTPILNNVITTFSPILYENNDTFHVKYQIIYSGQPEFGEYMQFVHEAFMQKENTNLLNEFTGSWTGSYES